MGVADWLAPKNRPGGMPPITLLTLLAVVVPLMLRWSANRTSRKDRDLNDKP